MEGTKLAQVIVSFFDRSVASCRQSIHKQQCMPHVRYGLAMVLDLALACHKVGHCMATNIVFQKWDLSRTQYITCIKYGFDLDVCVCVCVCVCVFVPPSFLLSA